LTFCLEAQMQVIHVGDL